MAAGTCWRAPPSCLVAWTAAAAVVAVVGAEVSCGGHSAATCEECPGANGPAWCNGDCEWSFNGCMPKGAKEVTGHVVQRHPVVTGPFHPQPVVMNGGPIFVTGGPRLVALQPGRGLDRIDPLALMLGNLGQIVASQHGGVPPGSLVPAGRRLPGHPLQPLMNPMQALMEAIGDASGHLGEASEFNVSDEEDAFRIAAHLPGHKLDQEGRGSDPLAVRIVERFVVVKGRHVNGHMMFEFQRSFRLPPRANVSAISVDYSTTSGKLVISVPKRPLVEGEKDEESGAPGGSEGRGAPPPPFMDLQNSLKQFFGDGERLGGQQGNLRRSASAPHPQQVHELFNDVVDAPHRNRTTSARVKDDNTTYVGCFSEDELPENRTEFQVPQGADFVQLRQSAAAHFGPWSGEGPEDVRFFAAALPLGGGPRAEAAFAFTASPHMPPHFGTADCGRPCPSEVEEAQQHWCGCAPSPEDPRGGCEGTERRRFAVHLLPQQDGSRAAMPRSRPVWHLGNDADGSPILEVHAPPGRKLKQDAGRLFVVKDDRPASEAADAQEGRSDGPAPGGGAKAADADHLAHVGVPVDLSEHDCALSDGGGELKCKLKEERVKEVPVHYTKDEL